MDRQEIYRTWAPAGSPWSVWAKPVLFTRMRPLSDEELKTQLPENPLKLRWLPGPGQGTAVILNLPGSDAIILGLFLAGQGYRPVPLYNTSPGPSSPIDATRILERLRTGTANLLRRPLPDDAPPVFLLDAQRNIGRAVKPGDFDNRWIVFPQDFPSAGFLKHHNIHRVLLVQTTGQRVDDDLSHVLRRWQQQDVAIEVVELSVSDTPVPITVRKPMWFRQGWYRLLAMWNYRRNPAGGFGARVPVPSGGGGYRAGGFG